MRLQIPYGLKTFALELPADRLIGAHRQPAVPALQHLQEAVATSLESPRDFPALRRALTPDDHIAIVVGERLHRVAELLVPIFEHVQKAGVSTQAITVVCPPYHDAQAWRDQLPDEYQSVTIEIHDPGNRKKLAYLAATRKGRRVYLNRTAVDADQLIVLSKRGYDPMLGYSGSEGSLYPILSDEATHNEFAPRLSLDVPTDNPWPTRREAGEIVWLLGAPFMIQVIEGGGDEIIHVIGGAADSGAEGIRLLNDRWRVNVDDLADTVIAGVSGSPERHDFGDLARAALAAARVVKPAGRIILLTDANPKLGPAAELLRQSDAPERALSKLPHGSLSDSATAFMWASAASRASIYVLSSLAADVVEEFFATPLENIGQVERLAQVGTVLVLDDAHQTLAPPPK